MASLIAKRKKNKLYYYVVDSARVLGRPRIVHQTYLGSAEKVAALRKERTAPLAARCDADKKAGGPADLFNMAVGLRGAVRMARKADDVAPGRHVWPDMTKPYWESLTYGYNAYQDGGYWYYMSLGIASTLWRKHPAEAAEWVANAYTDVTKGGDNNPYERIDGVKPVNNRYNASVGPLLGKAMPASVGSRRVTIAATSGP